MKTITEYFGPNLRDALNKYNEFKKEILANQHTLKAQASNAPAPSEPTESAPPAETTETTEVATSEEVIEISAEVTTAEASNEVEAVEVAPEQPGSSAAPKVSLPSPVNSSTEIEEELQKRMGEQFKLEGDKLGFFLKAIKLVQNRRGTLKRVVVSQPTEGEKKPSGVDEIDGHWFNVEFFPEPASSQGRGRREERNDRGGRNARGGRGDGRGGKDKGRGGRPGPGGRDNRGGGGGEVARGERSAFAPSSERAARPTRREPIGGQLPIVINPASAESQQRTARPPRFSKPRSEPRFDVEAVDRAIQLEPKYVGINRIKPKSM